MKESGQLQFPAASPPYKLPPPPQYSLVKRIMEKSVAYTRYQLRFHDFSARTFVAMQTEPEESHAVPRN
jgi:hypothetical protein